MLNQIAATLSNEPELLKRALDLYRVFILEVRGVEVEQNQLLNQLMEEVNAEKIRNKLEEIKTLAYGGSS